MKQRKCRDCKELGTRHLCDECADVRKWVLAQTEARKPSLSEREYRHLLQQVQLVIRNKPELWKQAKEHAEAPGLLEDALARDFG